MSGIRNGANGHRGAPGLHEPGAEMFRPGSVVVVAFESLIHDHHGHAGEMGQPVPGAATSLRRIKFRGCRILVESARPEFAVRAYLEQHGLPFDEIVSGEKRALFTLVRGGTVVGIHGDWNRIADRLQPGDFEGEF